MLRWPWRLGGPWLVQAGLQGMARRSPHCLEHAWVILGLILCCFGFPVPEPHLPQGLGLDFPVECLWVGSGAAGRCQAGEGRLVVTHGCKSPSDHPGTMRSRVTHEETPVWT